MLHNALAGSFKVWWEFFWYIDGNCQFKINILINTLLSFLIKFISRRYGQTYLSQWWLGRRRTWLLKSMRPSLPMPLETSSPISASAVLNSKRHPHDPCWPATERGTGVSIALWEAERGQEQQWHRGRADWQDSGSSATLKGLCGSKKLKDCWVCISGHMRAIAT